MVRDTSEVGAGTTGTLLGVLRRPPSRAVLLLLASAPRRLLPAVHSHYDLIRVARPPPRLRPRCFSPLVRLLSKYIRGNTLTSITGTAHVASVLRRVRSTIRGRVGTRVGSRRRNNIRISNRRRRTLVTTTCHRGHRLLVVAVRE